MPIKSVDDAVKADMKDVENVSTPAILWRLNRLEQITEKASGKKLTELLPPDPDPAAATNPPPKA